MPKFHTVRKCLNCKFCEVGRRYVKPAYAYKDLQRFVIMCGATGKYVLASKTEIDTDTVSLPDWCPLPETKEDDGICAVV